MERHLISFLLPAYKAQWIKAAIDSILSQTYEEIELVIVNDCSPDDIRSVVKTYDDKRIRYYENEENIGGKSLVQQWNRCISYAQGEFLVLAGDDDVYHPEFAQECMRLAMKYPEVDIVRARTEQIDEDGHLLGVDHHFSEFISQIEYAYRYRIGDAFICIGNFLFRTSALKNKGIVDFPKALGSDIATSISMSEHGMANTSSILFSFRQSSIHISGSLGDPEVRLLVIKELFNWLKSFSSRLVAKNKYELFYLSQMQENDWDEKRNYDYYSQVLSKVSIRKIMRLLREADGLSVKEKIKIILKRMI